MCLLITHVCDFYNDYVYVHIGTKWLDYDIRHGLYVTPVVGAEVPVHGVLTASGAVDLGVDMCTNLCKVRGGVIHGEIKCDDRLWGYGRAHKAIFIGVQAWEFWDADTGTDGLVADCAYIPDADRTKQYASINKLVKRSGWYRVDKIIQHLPKEAKNRVLEGRHLIIKRVNTTT